MIKLRLQRKGRKKRPFYHIVVADSRSPRDGRIIERLGRFDNVSEGKQLTYDEERVIHWLKIGAQPSHTVRNILKKEGILYKMHLMRWGKSEEEIEAAIEEWKAAREARHGDDDVSRKAQQKELLKAEEKEYKKQLEEKAAAAAKELEKKKAEEEKAKAEAEAEAAKAAEQEEAETAEEQTAEAADEQPEAEEAPETEAKEEKAEVKEEAPAEEKEEAKADAEEEKDEAEPAKEEAEAEEKKADAEEETADAPAQVSTDMNATEAIDHIKNTPLDDLKGFVPEDEDRVTVQRAWESKQAE